MQATTRPDYKFPVTVSAGTAKFEDIVCELRLPRRVVDSVTLRLFPTLEQLRVLANCHKFGIDYAAEGVCVTAETVYWEGGGSTTWPGGVRDQELMSELFCERCANSTGSACQICGQ